MLVVSSANTPNMYYVLIAAYPTQSFAACAVCRHRIRPH